MSTNQPLIALQQVSKVYYSSWSRARIEARHQAFLDLDLESPYDKRWFERPDQDHLITAKIPVDGFTDARREGLLAHATQIDPESTFWFGLPIDVDRSLYPVDDYRLAGESVVGLTADEEVETDLFAGVRTGASA